MLSGVGCLLVAMLREELGLAPPLRDFYQGRVNRSLSWLMGTP